MQAMTFFLCNSLALGRSGGYASPEHLTPLRQHWIAMASGTPYTVTAEAK